MSAFLLDWTNLLIRWAHMIVGIGWIGTSFYFVALDFSLRRTAAMDDRVKGEAWQVHGGGFYQVKKFVVAPDELPDGLIWFRWDAYLTWITGFILLVVQYYLNAETYLVDASKMAMSGSTAIIISVVGLASGWFIYDLICRFTERAGQRVTSILVFALICFAAWAFSQVYSGRGAMIHVGAFIGTIMAANVVSIIIPNQKRIIASLMAKESPDARLGLIGKQRSLHNNYLILPVLLMMVSNHYPLLYSHPHTWLVVALIVVVGAAIRHFINRHEAGDEFKLFAWALPCAAAALLATVFLTAPRTLAQHSSVSDRVFITDEVVLGLVSLHCSACHEPIEGLEEYFVAPMGVRLSTVEDILKHRQNIMSQSVWGNAMPMGNPTNMTAEERGTLGLWLEQSQKRQIPAVSGETEG